MKDRMSKHKKEQGWLNKRKTKFRKELEWRNAWKEKGRKKEYIYVCICFLLILFISIWKKNSHKHWPGPGDYLFSWTLSIYRFCTGFEQNAFFLSCVRVCACMLLATSCELLFIVTPRLMDSTTTAYYNHVGNLSLLPHSFPRIVSCTAVIIKSKLWLGLQPAFVNEKQFWDLA